MVSQNKNNPDGIAVGLEAMWKHLFGDHSSCLDWCSHRKNPHKPYKHLPNGKCLTDRNLQKALADVFSKYKKPLQEESKNRFHTVQRELEQFNSLKSSEKNSF